MTEVYTGIGFLVVWLLLTVIGFLILGYIIVNVTNWLGSKFKTMWIFIEYMYYRTQFKEWVKDKERIKIN